MKDRANIYKLSEDERKIISAEPLEDLAPNVKTFAKDFKEYIKNSDTPYVVGLNGGYGTGKTFFSTRFCEYLKNENIEAIYFSVWENDYLPNPFMAFSKEIVNYILRNSKKEKYKKLFESFGEKTLNLFKSAISSVNFSVSTGEGGIDISGKDFIEKLESYNSGEAKDPIVELKETLAELIQKLENKKLVLIVDELDRCRPDYAVKTLETIKHFFDIEGLFVVLPINNERLEACINGFYNLKINNSKEGYLQKFINDNSREIPKLDYANICNKELSEKIFDKIKNIDIEGEKYNSLFQLRKWLAHYSKGFQLTYREVLEVIKILIEVCKFEEEKIRCHYLAYRLCLQKNKNNNNRANYNIESNNPYRNISLLKSQLFNVINIANLMNNDLVINSFYYKEYDKFENVQINNYEELVNCIYKPRDNLSNFISKNCIDNGESFAIKVTNGTRLFKTIAPRNALKELENKIDTFETYLHEYGSDDNDEQRIKRYEEFVNNPEKLFKEQSVALKEDDEAAE